MKGTQAGSFPVSNETRPDLLNAQRNDRLAVLYSICMGPVISNTRRILVQPIATLVMYHVSNKLVVNRIG